ncbi:hypothetical protein FTV88_2772 [Heliorestis convoluta]|uniref:Uncharacterized protein n=1 Tax=Heliorestis convoluta TaxID=356322 RepID=A0A5Q2N3H4_9FIRM|nr:hypothetical protein FTV88_2772 [Heliorestis convoluta]
MGTQPVKVISQAQQATCNNLHTGNEANNQSLQSLQRS